MEYRLEGHYGYGRLMRSSVPLIGMMVLISLYSIVDGLFVSNLVGTTAFAALNLIWPALGLVGALGLMVGTGGAALVSKTFGEGDEALARRYFSMSVEAVLLLSVVTAFIVYKHRENFRRILNGTEVGLRKAHRGDMRIKNEKGRDDR